MKTHSILTLFFFTLLHLFGNVRFLQDRRHFLFVRSSCSSDVRKTHENPIDFNDSYFHKNSPQEISFQKCSTYNAFLTVRHLFCRTSSVSLTFFFWPQILRPFINRKVRALSFIQTQFSFFFEKCL